MLSVRFWSACVIVCSSVGSVAACSSKDSGSPALGTGGIGAAPSGAGGALSGAGGATTGNGGTVGYGGTTIAGNGGAAAGAGGGSVGTGGVTASGGAPAAGGSVNIGGQSNVSSLQIVGTVTKCADAPEPKTGDLSACSIEGCTGAHCVLEADLAAGTDKTRLSKCSEGSYCMPDDFIVTSGRYLAKKCTSLEGAEGRCLSTCIPAVNKQMKQLPQADCDETERCTPCFNPVDGEDTHACDQGCDTGPENKTPVLFDKCGYGRGVCVPPALVPEAMKTALASVQDGTCAKKDDANAAYLCAPAAKAKDIDFKFPACTSTSIAFAFATMTKPDGQKGGCIPHFLVATTTDALLIVTPDPCTQPAGAMANNKSEDLCAPCYDTSTPPKSTGACD